MNRIVFVIPNMSGGGAARVASILCCEWAAMGREVHLVTFEEPGARSQYPLDPRIERHQIGLSTSGTGIVAFATTNLRRLLKVRLLLRSIAPEVAVAFLLEANSTTALAGLGLQVRVFISERNHPGHDRISALRARIRAISYRRATRVVVQTSDIASWFCENLDLVPVVIPNPVLLPCASTIARKANNGRRMIVSLGRLEPQKGYDLLIEAFASIASQIPDWDLTIYGEGGERTRLEQAVAAHRLEGRIFLPGATSEPGAALSGADLYVQPSRYEGYPNALIEALAAGLCTVATDCPGASRELLGGGEYGVLTANENAAALAQALLSLAGDEARRKAFGTVAAVSIKRLASPDIARQWLSLFDGKTRARAEVG